MAYGLAIAKAYIDHGLARGLDIDACAGGLSFNFDIYGNLWEQVAKFRAGRRLWARILKEEYGATNPKRSMRLRMIAGGGGKGLTIEQPENNIGTRRLLRARQRARRNADHGALQLRRGVHHPQRGGRASFAHGRCRSSCTRSR